MSDDELTTEQISAITNFVDIEAPPPANLPTALVLFGTNQLHPVEIAAQRYKSGLAPLIIATGGVNRHSGIVEGRWFREQLLERGVADNAIRVEETSTNTWENVKFAFDYLREALAGGLPLTAVSKWYHRRTIHCLKSELRDIGPFYGISWEPVYAGKLVTRSDWPAIPDGRRRVLREWKEVRRRIEDGSFAPVDEAVGAWH